jgi:4-amino-4-deoxy-L-arabinose transferase-like glycosyltransferase
MSTMTDVAKDNARVDEGPRWPIEPSISRTVPLVVAVVFAALVATADRYGYHRDELYFLAAGRHLAWAYPDQGPITPLIARAMDILAHDSLIMLRLPAAIATAITVLLTGLLAREFGGTRRAQCVAVVCAGTAVVVVFTGHLLSTSTFALLTWTTVTWLAVRAIRTGADRLWLVAGLVLGIGLLNNPQPGFLAVGMLIGLLVTGPRRLLRNGHLWAGAAIAVVLWSPWLIWQGAHDWPELDISRSIAAGNSTSSQPWWAIVPFQALLAGPLLAPVWIAGLVRLFRDPVIRDARLFAWAWIALAVVFMASGGKPYYLAGLVPLLIGAGATSVDGWLSRGRRSLRRVLFVATVAVSAVAAALISLPLLPARDAGPIVAVNADVGETVGWPELARQVEAVQRRLPGAVILTDNYGEAGAIDRYGPALGLPPAFSGHNGYGLWGPPRLRTSPVVAVGFEPADLARTMRGCRVAARIGNAAGIDNGERGELILTCLGPRGSWAAIWPALRHLG